MRRSVSGTIASLAFGCLLACATEKGGGPPPVPDAGPTNYTTSLGGLDCDPMVPQECGFPFPSNVYTAPSKTTPTGLTVAFGATTLPIIQGNNIAGNQWNDSDGFSPGGAAMTYLPGATTTGFPGQDNISTSTTASSPTLLIDTTTMQLVPQFSELDVTDSTTTDQAILIHPVGRLMDATRYVVALQNVVDSTGKAIAPSPTFSALLNGTAAPMINVNGQMIQDPSVAARQQYYNEKIIPVLKSVLGASNLGGLQIAWDYTTASKQNNVGQLQSMYTQSLAALPQGGVSYTITSNSPNPDQYTAARIRGLITVPLFLNDANVTIDADVLNPDLSTGYIMTRVNGVPQQNGTGQFEFIVNIPKSAAGAAQPLPVMIYGHGLFSDRSEDMDADDNTYDTQLLLAQNQQFVTVSLDLLGWREPGGDTNVPGQYGTDWPADWQMYPDPNLENDQIKALGFVSHDAGQFRRMIDRGTQGMLNQLIAAKMMETTFAQDPAVKLGSGGASVIDTQHAYYRGDSQGGILGVTFMALTQDCLRGVLGETGFPYSMLVMRSQDFAQFLSALLSNYSSPNPQSATANPGMNVQLVIGVMQMFWDRLEGDGFVPYVSDSSNLIGLAPAHNVFIQDVLSDHQVTPLGAYNVARVVGATQLEPAINPTIYGIPAMSGPLSGNVIQEYTFSIAPAPLTDLPPPSSTDDPHDWVQLTSSSYLEIGQYLNTGSVSDDCGSDGGVPTTPTTCVYPDKTP